MRVLFFVEPFPVRNSMTSFRSVAERAAELCASSDVLDLRIFGNTETLALVGKLNSSVQPRLLWPTEEEEAYFRSQLVPWETEGLALWSECMQGGPASAPYVAVLERLRLEFPYDVIVHWGENGAVRQFVEEHELAHIGVEFGCSRKPFMDSYILDPLGTNGAALVPRLTIREIEEIVEGRETSAEECLLGCAGDEERSVYDSRFTPLPGELSDVLLRSRRKIAFLALQLYDDANLRQFSNYDDVREVVLDVVPKLAEAGYLVLIKPHPASHGRSGAVEKNESARAALATYADRVVWFDDPKSTVPNSRLMQLADLVVTVNSSVGFESLYFDKLAVVLGDAVYKPAGLFPSLDEAISGNYDRQAYLRNIGLLRTLFFESYLVEERWLLEPSLFALRVSTLVGIARRFPNDPFAMTKAMFAAFAPAGGFLRQRTLAAGSSAGGRSRRDLASVEGFRRGTNLQPVIDALKAAAGTSDPAVMERWLKTQWLDYNARAKAIRDLGILDDEWYLNKYPKVRERGVDPLESFCLAGESSGRLPSPLFEPRAYAKLPDPKVLSALINVVQVLDARADAPKRPSSADDAASTTGAVR